MKGKHGQWICPNSGKRCRKLENRNRTHTLNSTVPHWCLSAKFETHQTCYVNLLQRPVKQGYALVALVTHIPTGITILNVWINLPREILTPHEVGNPEFFPPAPEILESILLAESLLILSSELYWFADSHVFLFMYRLSCLSSLRSTAHLLLLFSENHHSQKYIAPPKFMECLLIARHWIGTEDT